MIVIQPMSYYGKKILLILQFLLIGNSLVHAQQPDLIKYVNTLQGTNSNYELSYGNTYPTVALPFGMHTWTPQTGKNGEGWKYQYDSNTIRGFQQSHQCSPWVNDYAVFSLMPVKDELVVDENKRASPFSHKNEIAKPNYYKVKFDNGIITEFSPTTRGAHFRFSFSKSKKSYIVLDGYTKMSLVKIIPEERKIIGYVNNQRFAPGNFKNYFIIQFDQPFVSYGTWENTNNKISKGNLSDQGIGKGAYVEFEKGISIEAKVASSYLSIDQAQISFDRELSANKDLEVTREAAAKIWNDLLNRILVEGGTEEQKATFYSCLFRANLFSRQFFEYDRENHPIYYSPYDGKPHEGFMYTDNGFWDTFRSQFPLTNILHPSMQGHYMQALLDAQKQFGWLPAWSFPGETGGMLGNHAISLLTDAWVKGIHSFNPDSALIAYAHESMNKGPLGGANGRQGWKEYFEIGYVPYPESEGSTAQTLEYAYDDFCAYQLAKATGNSFYEKIFARQMYNYKNVYDSTVGFMRGRKINGEWVPNFNPYAWGGPFTEANAWQYSWSVFHDVRGLISLMGGDQKFVNKIDSVFSVTDSIEVGTYHQMIHEMKEMTLAKMGQYAHGNQPIQHMIYLYSYAGQPWKTQYHIRKVLDELYHSSEKGYPGDEDQGGMSSWYILSAMGIYSVCPGTDQYVIGSPLFKKTTITMEDGRKFIIDAGNNNKENVYIKSAMLNGKNYAHNWISYADIRNGGVLHLEMSNQPERSRGVAEEDKPYSVSVPGINIENNK